MAKASIQEERKCSATKDVMLVDSLVVNRNPFITTLEGWQLRRRRGVSKIHVYEVNVFHLLIEFNQEELLNIFLWLDGDDKAKLSS